MNIFTKLRYLAEGYYYKFFGLPVVKCGSDSASKRALLIYLSLPLKWKKNDIRFNAHQNFRQSRQIAELLIQRGYQVEVVQHNDKQYIPSGSYDLVISHSGVVAERLQALKKTGYRLCMRTGRYSSFVDKVTGQRYALLGERRGKHLKWNKVGKANSVYDAYDAIACFDANGTTSATFSEIGIPAYAFRNYANPMIEVSGNKAENANKGFIYLAGHLHVLKGLDWLIESFAQRPELDLYICGRVPDDLMEIYQDELGLPNIHAMGFVSLTSKKFQNICKSVYWYVSASASEGCSGAVMDAMAAGLIPIVTEACGVDTHGAGFTMQNPNIELLGVKLDAAAAMSSAQIEEHSLLAREVIERWYQPEHFADDWSRILDQVEAQT